MDLAPVQALRALRALFAEARDRAFGMGRPARETWIAKAEAVLDGAFGVPNSYTERLRKVRYMPAMVTEWTTEENYRASARSGVQRAAGILDAAIHYLELITAPDDREGSESPSSDEPSYDQGLWRHVRTAFQNGEWSTVAMLVAQYVEHHIRELSELKEDEAGKPLVGKNLTVKAFAADGPLRLGSSGGEYEGWRNLATGFVQALSNVDRHRIQDRPDIEAYALGVLGAGSLIMVQLRYQHPDRFI